MSKLMGCVDTLNDNFKDSHQKVLLPSSYLDQARWCPGKRRSKDFVKDSVEWTTACDTNNSVWMNTFVSTYSVVSSETLSAVSKQKDTS